MRDVTEELARYGEAVEQAVPAAPRPATGGTTASSRARGKPALVVAAALVAVVPAVTALWLTGQDGDRAGGTAPSDAAQNAEPDPAPGWYTADLGPLEHREEAAVVWTGDELVVWGGEEPGGDDGGRPGAVGAAFDPRSDRWREMEPGPLEPGRATAVWTGTEVLVWRLPQFGQSTAPWEGAAWDPATGSWRSLQQSPAAPADDIALELVWSDPVVVAAGLDATYDPATDEWQPLPTAPGAGVAIAAAPLGDEVVVLRSPQGTRAVDIGAYSPPSAAAIDPSHRTWRELEAPAIGTIGAKLVPVGDRLLALDYEMQTTVLPREASEWITQDPLALRFYEGLPIAAGVDGRAVVVRSTGTALFDPHEGWALAPAPPAAVKTLVPGNGAVVGLSPLGVVAYVPPEFDAHDLAPTGTFPVGTLLLDVPEGSSLTASGLTEERGGIATVLDFRLTAPGERDCRMTSTYHGRAVEGLIRRDAESQGGRLGRLDLGPWPHGSGDQTVLTAGFPPGTRSSRAHLLLAEAPEGASDVTEVICDDLDTAQLLASGLRYSDPIG